MKSSRYTEEQIIGILKQHQAGLGAKELCRKHGISDATFYKWRSKYGGMEVSDAKRLKALEDENRNGRLCGLQGWQRRTVTMTRNNELGSKRFIELPTWLAIPAAGFGAVIFEVFHHFGLAGAGRVAAFFAFALFGVIAKCRPLWREPWLWFFSSGQQSSMLR